METKRYVIKQKKILWADPWVGEFGWELFCWQGYLRKLAEKYDRVIVACRTGHDLLYRDFADEIVHYDPAIEETDMHKNHREPDHHKFHQYYTSKFPSLTVIHNNRYPSMWWKNEHWNKRQSFVPFTISGGSGYDVLMCLRDTDKCNTGFRNWPIAHATTVAEDFLSKGLTVACVGKRGSALWVPGTEDCRDYPLDQLAQIMNNSKVIVGPQCGPLHFATLCGLPQVSWQTKPEHATRTEKHWNPYSISVTTMPSNESYWRRRIMWLPEAVTVVYRVLQMLHKERTR